MTTTYLKKIDAQKGDVVEEWGPVLNKSYYDKPSLKELKIPDELVDKWSKEIPNEQIEDIVLSDCSPHFVFFVVVSKFHIIDVCLRIKSQFCAQDGWKAWKAAGFQQLKIYERLYTVTLEEASHTIERMLMDAIGTNLYTNSFNDRMKLEKHAKFYLELCTTLDKDPGKYLRGIAEKGLNGLH